MATKYLNFNRVTLTDNNDMPIIDIREWKGVFTNGDVEDIPENMLTELKNLRPYHGRLIKTHGFGIKIADTTAQILDNLTTYINDNIVNNGNTDSIYLGYYVTANTATMTDTSIAFVNSNPDTITDSNNQFVSEGFLAGDMITVSGSTSNDGNYIVETVVAGTLTLSASDSLTAEGAAATVTIAATTNGVTLFGYKETGSAWDFLGDLTDFVIAGTYYHKNAKNPVFSYNKNIRFLPGNVSKADSSNESKGIWVGHIGYDLFDEDFTTTKKFYDYDVTPAKPDISLAAYEDDYTGSGSAPGTPYYYKQSYIYDGNQESLLSDLVYKWTPSGADKMLRLQWLYDQPTYNMRITGIKLYRATSLNGTYELLTFIDLLRQASDVPQGANGSYDGLDKMCIPALTGYTFDTDYNHLISTDAGTTIYPIEGEVAGTGNTVFNYKAAVITDTSIAFVDNGGTDQITDSNSNFLNEGFNAGDVIVVTGASDNNGTYTISTVVAGTITLTGNLPAVPEGAGDSVTITAGIETSAADDWDDNWKLYRQLKAGGAIATVAGQASTTGGNYWGVNTIIVPTAYTDQSLIGGIFKMIFASVLIFVIDDNYDKAVHISDVIDDQDNHAYKIAKPSIGLYLTSEVGDDSRIQLWDTLAVTPSGEHPLIGEVSIKVNGKFAEMISGRLWQANIVLDPGNKGEIHDDWASYSELYQPDVNPVSNARRIPDREGGEITGLAQVFGNPVFLKKQAIVRLDVTIASGTPTTWKTIESPHNIGNIAPNGYITVLGNLYVVYYDGIYRIKPSNYSITDSTPTENLRISDPITDTFETMTDAEKAQIRCEYDQNLSEIIYIFPLVGGDETWAFNIDTEQWREIETAITLNESAIFALDEVADVMVYDASDKKVYTLNVEEDVDVQFNTKTFPIAFKRSKLVKYLTLRYKSDETIALNVYSDIEFTEGNLIMGKEYRIHDNSGSLIMTNIGAADNNEGTEFTAAIVMTATTIAFFENTPSADTITDSDSNFLNNGYLAGDTIVITGDSDNNGTYTIDTVVAGTITLDAGDDLIAEGAGDSVTITGSVTERAPTSWGTGSAKQISSIATKTLPIHPEVDNETVYIGRWVKEFNLQFTTS